MLTRRDVLKRLMAVSAAGLLPSAAVASPAKKVTQTWSKGWSDPPIPCDHTELSMQLIVVDPGEGKFVSRIHDARLAVSFRDFNGGYERQVLPLILETTDHFQTFLSGRWNLAPKQRQALLAFLKAQRAWLRTVGVTQPVGEYSRALRDAFYYVDPVVVKATKADYAETVDHSILSLEIRPVATAADAFDLTAFITVQRRGHYLSERWRIGDLVPFKENIFQHTLIFNDWNLSLNQRYALWQFQDAMVDWYVMANSGLGTLPPVLSQRLGRYMRRHLISSLPVEPEQPCRGFAVVPNVIPDVHRIVWVS